VATDRISREGIGWVGADTDELRDNLGVWIEPGRLSTVVFNGASLDRPIGTVRLGTVTRRVVTVPREAVDSGGFMVVWDTARPVLRQVIVGADLPGDRVEVVDGLAPGERVVRTGR